jgi:transposase
MPSRKRERQLFDAMWARVEPLLPPKRPHPKGGRPRACDRGCFEGIVYLLRNGIRWNAMPKCYPSSTTCWNRYQLWTKLGIWSKVWTIVLEELDALGELDLEELTIDATFAEARKGGPASDPPNAGSATRLSL